MHGDGLRVPVRPIEASIRYQIAARSFTLFASQCQNAATIVAMHLAIFGMRLLEVMFFVGLVGSSVVVLISFIEDGKELFGDE